MLSPRQLLTSALLLGAALWVSRAVVGVSGDGVRVAYVPSAPELVGLVVLGGLLLVLAQAVVERGLGRVRDGAQLPAEACVPLGALLLLFVPYVPWVAERAPVAGELAGPLGWWVWAAVAATALWALAASLPPGARGPGPIAAWLGVGAASAALLLGARAQLTPGPLYPGGDEPHYLVVTQSLLADGDLRIDDNHARGDYRAYYDAPLEPDHIVPASADGAIYSIHPVGVSLLVAPAFRLDGYRGASLTIVAAGVAASMLLWSFLRGLTGAPGAAAFGWLAVVTSAPFVLHAFAIYPEVPAALAVLVAVGWRRGSDTPLVSLVRGAAIGALPWLGTKYAPMAAVIAALAAWRLLGRRTALAALAAPAGALAAAWLAWFWWIWGSPSPAAPYGSAHQMAVSNLAAGLPGLLFDQEYGVLAVAPVLGFAGLGWWRLWRQGPGHRALLGETALPPLALALTVGAYAMWWGGSAPPGRQLVAALPLLGVPLSVLWQSRDTSAACRALLVVLLAGGMAATATLALAQQGLLIANQRDGVSTLLEYLSPSGALGGLMPSFTADRSALAGPLARVAIWGLAAAVLWRAATAARSAPAGRAGLLAIIAIAGAVTSASAIGGGRPGAPARALVQSPMLDAFDASARPVGVVLDPWRLVPPETIPPLMRFEATPGLRVARQPLPVLLNMRLSLPAGTYAATIEPRAGQTVSGPVGLQIGRTGPPRQVWDVQATSATPWSQTFTLDLDANFVGLRAGAPVEQRVGRIVVAPVSVIDVHRRLRRPAVLAAATLGGRPAYFHDTRADVERTGFWVRADVTSMVTLAVDPIARPHGVRLRLHSGAGTSTVRLVAGPWSADVALAPGSTEIVHVPALPSQRLLPLTVTPDGGFVPAEHGGPPADRRRLGCWVEVLP